MVFCRQCRQQVENCVHFVPPLKVRRVQVFDPKVKSLAYDEPRRILEIAFKNGQTWQLKPVSPEIYQELLHQTLSSFLKFIAHRYESNPVMTKPSMPAALRDDIPHELPCTACQGVMTIRHQTAKEPPARVLWECKPCQRTEWRTYGQDTVREKRTRWH